MKKITKNDWGFDFLLFMHLLIYNIYRHLGPFRNQISSDYIDHAYNKCFTGFQSISEEWRPN